VTARTADPGARRNARLYEDVGSVGPGRLAMERARPVERAGGGHPAPAVSPVSAAAEDAGFRHAAAVVGTDDDLLAVALPFVDAGLRVGDLVALSCSPETAERVGAEIGAAAEHLEVDRALTLLGARPPDAIRAARRYVMRAADRPTGRVRILSEVDFGDRPAGWREGQRFEAVCNLLMRHVAISTVCVYDRRRLPPEVLDSAALTHPDLVAGAVWTPSPAFQEPRSYIRALPAPREPVEDTPPVFAADDLPSLVALRHALSTVLGARVPDREQREDLHLGASEVAANAFRHGTRPVSARIWADDRHLVCAITDAGHSFTDPLAGFQPAHGDDLSRGGMGLWLARKLWDHVDLVPGPGGLTVRLSTRLR
jgi:anti-sigma regulatory factor (Ser/Thr protein kinase)